MCKDLGFNAYGFGCPNELKSDMPYLMGRNYVPISLYLGCGFCFIDIVDPEVQQRLKAQVKQRCLENRDKPNLIGYYWTDLGVWPLKNSVGKNWVEFIRDLRAEVPGRKAYAEFLSKWQGNDAQARDLAFLRHIARAYFRVMGEETRKHDPDHLIFGVTGFQKLKGEAKRIAKNDFYTERKKQLGKFFTEEQWGIWSSFWN